MPHLIWVRLSLRMRSVHGNSIALDMKPDARPAALNHNRARRD